MTKRTIAAEADATGAFAPPPAPAGAAPCATAAGTLRYAARHREAVGTDHFRTGPAGLTLSAIGLGTYLGADADSDDDAYTDAVRVALRSGINVIDTAINYRCQRSERAVGRALQGMLDNEQLARDEVVICTKAGYIPLDGNPPATAEGYQGYLRREFYARGVMTAADVVAGGHCLAPDFLEECLRRSKANLGLAAVDVFYLHNPEQQLVAVSPEELRVRVRAAFERLERLAAEGAIGAYGLATWQGLRVPPAARGHLGLESLVALAREVAGDSHRFEAVQLPLNLAMLEALRAPTQPVDGHLLPAIDAAVALGLNVVASAPLMQGQLAQGLPATLREMFPALDTDAQRAVAFVRTAPGVSTTLVGMKRPAHVLENIRAGR